MVAVADNIFTPVSEKKYFNFFSYIFVVRPGYRSDGQRPSIANFILPPMLLRLSTLLLGLLLFLVLVAFDVGCCRD